MSATFNPPPSFDDSLNISQWIQYTAKHSPEHPMFAYAEPGLQQQLCVVTWSQMGAAVEQAASLVDFMFDFAAASESPGEAPPVIGVLANLDSITYHVVHLGIIRAGGTAFLISTKNSPAAIAHLLKETGTRKLLVSTDDVMQELVNASIDLARKQEHDVVVHTAPTFSVLFENDGSRFTRPAGLETRTHLPALILHSSGSTSFPKPITITHHSFLQWARRHDILGADLPSIKFAVHALPVFHTMGVLSVIWATVKGLTLTVFPPRSPPVMPSPSAVLEYAVASGSSFMLCVPLFVEVWSRDPATIPLLKSFDGIVFSGGPFNYAIGEDLSALGVRLVTLYGTTEIGPGTTMVKRDPKDPEWSWLQLLPTTDARFLPQDDSNTFELVFVESPTFPVISNSTIDGARAFATSDIVVRHPTDPLKFKIQGRKDEQIILSSGEKTNPGPLELIICKSPLVGNAVMFGRGREQNGVIVQPVTGREFDPADISKLSQFRNDIWENIAEANEFAPGHSRLFKEMVLVTYPTRPMLTTPKHTLRRGVTLAAYKDEIDAAYRAVHDSTQTAADVPLPTEWTFSRVRTYVRAVVHRIMERDVADDADIFEQGGDSLLATYIRNSLIHAVRKAHINKGTAAGISQNFVYDYPTIARMAGRLAVVDTTAGTGTGVELDDITLKLQAMEDAVTELSTHFPEHRPANADTGTLRSGEVVLLTGTTGGLGSQLLTSLASSPDTSRIYAFNRPSGNGGKSLRERQIVALIEKGLDPGVVDSSKVVLVEGDTAREWLGVDPDLYDEIRDSITLIIHNAWRVHFNLGFATFKPNIRGVRTLIDLALGSPLHNPPRIIFLSSVGIFRNWNVEARGKPLESPLEDPKVVLGNGYGESKYVGEQILANAASSTPLRPVIVRVGQLTSTASGAWNKTDWLPAIVRSGQVVGVLPARSDCVAWISLETAAQAIFDFRHSQSQYIHLAHPNPAPWSAVFDVFSSRLNVPLASWDEWLDKLQRSDVGAGKNPAVHLLEFFAGCAPEAADCREALGIPLMDLRHALEASPALANAALKQIGGADVDGWLRHWREVGLLEEGAGQA